MFELLCNIGIRLKLDQEQLLNAYASSGSFVDFCSVARVTQVNTGNES